MFFINTKRTRFSLAILFIGLFLQACQKESEVHQPPVVTFISPTQGDYNETDTIPIRIQIVSEDDLHEYSVNIKNLTENKTAFTYNGHSHGRTVDINLSFMPNVSVESTMQLTVTMLDHNGNQSEKSMTFKVKNTVASMRPVITIFSPDLFEYQNGDQVQIRAEITHANYLQEVNLQLTKNGVVVFELQPAVVGKKSYNFDTTIAVSSTSHATYVFTATALGQDSLYELQRTYFDVHL